MPASHASYLYFLFCRRWGEKNWKNIDLCVRICVWFYDDICRNGSISRDGRKFLKQGQALQGMFMLLAYSLGLGIPFVLSAVLIEYLKSVFNWIKKHYNIINLVSGSLLVLIGILMATGMLGRFILC